MTTSEESLRSNSTAPAAYVRDKDYYFEDGSIIVLAEDRLFKIHRTLFERNSPFFRSLMSLPQCGDQESPEGQSDENPVVCPDPVEDFRALCWVVYSSPTDILAQQTWRTTNASKLICVVAISHKYDFTAYCEWAWKALDACYTAQPLNFFHKCGTWFAVGRIFKLAIVCGKKSMVDRLRQAWLDQISSSRTRVTAFKEALDVVEGSDLFREFHAKCYYVYLQSSGAFVAQAQDTTPLNLNQVGSYIDATLADLSSERRMRLLAGFWSLSRLRGRLSQPPKLMDNPSCGKHTSECIPGWESWWKDAMNNAMGLGDPGQQIEYIAEKANSTIGTRRQPSPYGFHDTITPIPCQSAVRSTIAAVKRDFYASLASRFMLS